MDEFSAILMIAVNDGVCQGFPQRDFNVALPLRNAAAIPEQGHEFVHEGGNRGHFAWQGALQSDMRVPVIMRFCHSPITLPIEIGLLARPRYISPTVLVLEPLTHCAGG